MRQSRFTQLFSARGFRSTWDPLASALDHIENMNFAGLGNALFGTLLVACPLGALLGFIFWASGRLKLAPKGSGEKHAKSSSLFPGSLTSTSGETTPKGEDVSTRCPSPSSPRSLAVLSEPSQSATTGGGVGEMADFPDTPVVLQYMQRAQKEPNTLAATFGDRRIDAGELRQACIEAAVLFKEAGIAEKQLVAIYLPPGMSSIVSIFGTWLAEGAWIPIDREAPPARVELLLKEGQPKVVVCDDDELFRQAGQALLRPAANGLSLERGTTSLTPFTPSERERSNQELEAEAWRGPASESVAQVIYTSGSTGLPKGVIYSQRRLAFACHFFAQKNEIREGTKVLQKTPYIWAVFRHEVFPALCHGGSLVVAEQHERKDPTKLAKLLLEQAVEVIVATPSVLELVIAAAGSCPQLKQAICMGEPLQVEVARRILEGAGPALTLHNFYGSTETENTHFTVPPLGDLSWHSLTRRHLPAGRPQPQVSVHVLDPLSLEIRAPNVTGEICFGGVLSDGYWQRQNLTSEKFIDHPSLGRIYRTGDVGSWDPELGLQVVGRTDRQVKIRGIRIELEEVEARLKEAVLAAGGTEAAAVAAPAPGSIEAKSTRTAGSENAQQDQASDHLILVAFAAGKSKNGGSLDAGLIRQKCVDCMPPYMVPTTIQTMEELPRLPNQKVDLTALAQLAETAEETVQALDSLGMLRQVSRAQAEEDVWIHNQQAFWMLAVMLEHLGISKGIDPGCCNLVWSIMVFLGHGKDMIAFTILAGLTDSRDPIAIGPRDLVLVFMAFMMSGPISYVLSPNYGPLNAIFRDPDGMFFVGAGWFLYALIICRLCLLAFHRLQIRPAVQIGAMFVAAALFPEDILYLIPLPARAWLWSHHGLVMYKSVRFCVFMTASYLMGFYAGPPAIAFARRKAPSNAAVVAALVGACWAGYFTMTTLNGLSQAYPGFQAVFVEKSGSQHLVMWHYMTHPSLGKFLLLWVGEVLLFFFPVLFVAIAMAYFPIHLKTMGSTTFGNYILHGFQIGAPWIPKLMVPILTWSTAPWHGLVLNTAIGLMWNVLFCLAFAHTFGAWMHWFLVAFFYFVKQRNPWQ